MKPPSEFVSTAHSPLTDHHLHAWGWEIPLYLFLGGLTAGILVLTGYALWRGHRNPAGRPSFSLASSGLHLIGLATISLGMLALFLDLTHKPYVWRLYLTFRPLSPMSWGAWILLLVYPVLALGVLLDPPAWLRARFPDALARFGAWADRGAVRRRIGMVAVIAGVALGIYTGVLLSALGARPLWSSALLGPLFLVSGVSTGAALAHWLSPDHRESELLLRVDNALITAELALLGLLLVGHMAGNDAQMHAASLLLGGPYTAVFWVGVVFMGLALPLVIQIFTVTGRIAHSPVAPVLVLAGGVLLRFIFVYAGQASHWMPL